MLDNFTPRSFKCSQDMGSGKIVLTHPTGREELNESFQVEVDEYLK